MAPSSSSSTNSQIGRFQSTSAALWVGQDPAMDHNGAFNRTQGNFEARLEVLKASGVFVVSRVFELFKEVSEYIQSTHPEGIDLLGLRIHADEKSLPLSRKPGGSYSLANPEEGRETIENIFSKVRKFVMIEGCKTGFGKNGILKHVVSLCRPGVVGIGSRGSEFEVGFDSVISGYMRFECLRSKQDITRIYYKTENGATQNIPVEELMLLWDLFKEKCTTPEAQQRGFELCYKLLGERNDPSTFLRIRTENEAFIHSVRGSFESIRKQLLEVEVTRSLAKSIWVEMLKGLEAVRSEFGVAQEISEIPVDQVERAMTPDQIVTDRGALRVGVSTSYQKVYRFILGCAFIDKYKPLLMLLDDGTGFGPASQAIRALSGLTIHGDDSLSITAILAHYFPVIKKSYLTARNSYLIKDWFQGVSKGVCFNNVIKFIDEFYEERILPSKEERLRIAVLKGNGVAVQRLIEQGVNFDFKEAEIEDLKNKAISNRYFFVAYLIINHFSLKDKPEFINYLSLQYSLECKEDPVFLRLDSQVLSILKSLLMNRDLDLAFYCADLIKRPNRRVEAFCECIHMSSVLGKVNRAIKEFNKFYSSISRMAYFSNQDLMDRTAIGICEMACKFLEFEIALEAAQLVSGLNFKRNAFDKVFNEMLSSKKMSFEELINRFKSIPFGYLTFGGQINRLLETRDYSKAFDVFDEINNIDERNKVSEMIVMHLLDQGRPDEACIYAKKITDENIQNICFFRIIQNCLKSQYLYAALDAARLIVNVYSRYCALDLVFERFIDLGCPHLASHLANEISELNLPFQAARLMKNETNLPLALKARCLVIAGVASEGALLKALDLVRELSFPTEGFSQEEVFTCLSSQVLYGYAQFMNSEQSIEHIKELVPYLRSNLNPNEDPFDLSFKVKVIIDYSLKNKDPDEARSCVLLINNECIKNECLVNIFNFYMEHNNLKDALDIAKLIKINSNRDRELSLVAQKFIEVSDFNSAFNTAKEMKTHLPLRLIPSKPIFERIFSSMVQSGLLEDGIKMTLSLGALGQELLSKYAESYQAQGQSAVVSAIRKAIK